MSVNKNCALSSTDASSARLSISELERALCCLKQWQEVLAGLPQVVQRDEYADEIQDTVHGNSELATFGLLAMENLRNGADAAIECGNEQIVTLYIASLTEMAKTVDRILSLSPPGKPIV